MSMTRDDALAQLARGLRKFSGYTAGQVLDAAWPGLLGLHAADLEFFEARRDQPAHLVAQACQGRSRINAPHGSPALAPSAPEVADSVVHLRVPSATKARWVRASQANGEKLGDWIVERVEREAAEWDACNK